MTHDIDPKETQEWRESLAAVIKQDGTDRAQFVLDALLEEARNLNIPSSTTFNSSFVNTIAASDDMQYPGDLTTELQICNYLRWNTIAMVVRAGKFSGLGGHIASFCSLANLLEVGFHHFFRNFKDPSGGDLLYLQGHSSEGIYARSYIERRFDEEHLEYFRREVSSPKGVSSYPHPWLMPDYWQFPTVSMGLGALQAIYQAKFLKYLEHRKLSDNPDRKVWCFCGDGEMDEPESRGALHIAGRENLNNLIFVINCNLQRLDGPVYGNGKIVQELEAEFSAAGWRVIKVLWGKKWDKLFARDVDGVLTQKLNSIVDGELQNCAAKDGAYIREHFFGTDPKLKEMVADLTDDELKALMRDRGGHCHEKIYTAYHQASQSQDKPTVVLALSIKGYGLGEKYGESENIAHNFDKMDDAGLNSFCQRFELPLSKKQISDLKFYRPAKDAAASQYLIQQRENLGGTAPARRTTTSHKLAAPKLNFFDKMLHGFDHPISTTMAFGRIFSSLLRDKNIAKFLVPIFSDEARTFGMEALFRQIGIYSSKGQLYTPEDSKSLISYKESTTGQVLEEGISEAGSMCSWLAAASSYSSNDINMMPFFIFYSMFGFQRIGDLIWAASDMRARGFLMGATAGRTTLNGEGLQHQDGHSHVMALTNPNCIAYDPAFAYELAVIIQHGLYEMYELERDVFYYITIMNENYAQPAMPQGSNVTQGILQGLYLFQESTADHKLQVQLFGSGAILNEAILAAKILEEQYNISANIWSVTSYNQLMRDGMNITRHNLLHPDDEQETYLSKTLQSYDGPIIAASDYIRSHMEQIRAYLPHNNYTTLGTDGFGRSDTRAQLREFFEVDASYIVLTALQQLVKAKKLDRKIFKNAFKKLNIDTNKVNPWDL